MAMGNDQVRWLVCFLSGCYKKNTFAWRYWSLIACGEVSKSSRALCDLCQNLSFRRASFWKGLVLLAPRWDPVPSLDRSFNYCFALAYGSPMRCWHFRSMLRTCPWDVHTARFPWGFVTGDPGPVQWRWCTPAGEGDADEAAASQVARTIRIIPCENSCAWPWSELGSDCGGCRSGWCCFRSRSCWALDWPPSINGSGATCCFWSCSGQRCPSRGHRSDSPRHWAGSRWGLCLGLWFIGSICAH